MTARCPVPGCNAILLRDRDGEPVCVNGHSGARLMRLWSPPKPEPPNKAFPAGPRQYRNGEPLKPTNKHEAAVIERYRKGA